MIMKAIVGLAKLTGRAARGIYNATKRSVKRTQGAYRAGRYGKRYRNKSRRSYRRRRR